MAEDMLKKQHEQFMNAQLQNTEVFHQMGTQLTRVTSTLIAQGAMNGVSEFSGTDKVSDWLLEIDKFRSIHGLNDKDTCQLAWAKSKGDASRQIGRRLNEQPDIAWSVLKEEISREFGKIVDNQQAFLSLTSIRQGRSESLNAFIERFLALTSRVYGDETRSALIEGQLVAIFLEGLRSREVKVRIYRQKVNTVKEAIQMVKLEEVTKRRFPDVAAVTVEEPMEIDQHRPTKCFQCGGPHRSQNCKLKTQNVRRVNTMQRPRTYQNATTAPRGHMTRRPYGRQQAQHLAHSGGFTQGRSFDRWAGEH